MWSLPVITSPDPQAARARCTPVIGTCVTRRAVATTLAPADPSWVWAEVELWVIAPLPLAVALLVARRQPA